ncbi:MAG: ABC transporter substrate-binding protein [Chloroflexi bacterium]|nr:MAG: ABC transporter substrate-binding protein [Chloroflexota bacterium]
MQVDEKQIALTRSLMAHFEAHGVSRRNFLKLLATAGGGAALSSLIAACGGDDDDDAPTATSAAAAPTATTAGSTPAAPEATPTTGGTTAEPMIAIIASGQDISNLDPHTGHDYSIASTQKSVYDTLLRYYGNPAEIQNVLATEYEANEDASVWTFKLDERAVFHDGTPVTASDVVYSAGRLIRKNLGAAWMFVAVMDETSAVAVDEHTVTMTLKSPFSPFPLILPWLFIVNEKVVREHEVDGDEGEGWLLDHEAGSGGFTIKSWQVGDSYEFEAVPDYWFGWPEQGRLAGYVWKIMRESSSQRLALLSGEIHMAHGLSSDDFVAVASEPGFESINEPGLSVFALKLNNQRGPTSDVNVRKAIAYAMDYDAVITALNGRASLLEGPLPNLGDFVNPNLNLYRLDMDKAKEHLEMSEYPDGGFELEFVYVTGLQIEEQIGLILLDNLSKLGITLNMQALVWPDMVARAKEVETAPDIMAVYSGTSYADPDNFLWQAYHSSQAGFWAAASHYKNPELDKILEDARSTPDHQKRVELYHKAQEILVEDAVEVWIQNQWNNWVWTDKLVYQYTPIMGQYIQPMYFLS